MTVRIFLMGAALSALVTTLVWVLIVFYLDPEQAGPLGYILFFLSLFLALASWAALTGYGARRVIMLKQFAAYTVRTSLRQSIFLSAFACLLLFFQLLRLYRWWLTILLIIFFITLELIFLSYDRAHSRNL
jgi:hypothetical protein